MSTRPCPTESHSLANRLSTAERLCQSQSPVTGQHPRAFAGEWRQLSGRRPQCQSASLAAHVSLFLLRESTA